MGRDLRLAAINRFINGNPSNRFTAWPKAMPKPKEADEDDADDEDDDATDADDDDESDEDQEDSSGDDDDDADDEDDEDDEDASSSKKPSKSERKPRFRVPKSQDDLDRMIAKRLERKEREVAAQVKADLKREADLAAAKKRGDSEKVIKALEEENARLKEATKNTNLTEIKRRVAERAGLPASAAVRLVGETEAEIRADAKALRKELGITTSPDGKQKPDDRGESNKPRGKGKGSGEQEDWQKPEFWIQD